jgi:hypothetical protein
LPRSNIIPITQIIINVHSNIVPIPLNILTVTHSPLFDITKIQRHNPKGELQVSGEREKKREGSGKWVEE